MTFSRRNKCVIKGATTATSSSKVMPHCQFIDRIRNSLYFGAETHAEEMELSRPLAEFASELFSQPHKGHSLNRLNSVEAGNVHATPCSLIMALIYLDRLNIIDPGYVRRITPQELFIVSMMVSTKFYAGHDENVYLSDWAADGDMTEKRLKQLELEFLCAIEWNIYISNEQFFEKLASIEKTLARREGLRRGWLTYTELIQLLPSFTLAKFLLNNITIMMVSYAASVMTIAGAFFLASQIPGTALHRKTVTVVTPPDVVCNMSESVGDTIMPAKHDLHNQTQKQNATADNVIIANNDNSNSCIALNVEAELLKLERQYREEALREDLRRRNNEIATDSRLTLPVAIGAQHANKAQRTFNDAQHMTRNWLGFKQEYSDNGRQQHQQQYLNDAFGQQQQQKKQATLSLVGFADCLSSFKNCTDFLFWQLLADSVQQSYVQLPLTWFKFI